MLTRQEAEANQRKMTERRRKAAHAKHRKANKGLPPSKEAVAAFVATIQRTPLGPPAPSMIRFLLPPAHPLASFHDRTLSSWYLFVEQWKATQWFTKAQGDAIKTAIETAVYRNLRIRWILRKWIRRFCMRKADAKNTDPTDLCTTLPIPERALVTIYDMRNRNMYRFHYQTLQTLIQNSLLFQQYGIANPLYPKNPYTNLRWSHGQLLSIQQQIGECSAYHGRLPPPLLSNFRQAGLCLRSFTRQHRVLLHTQAAVNFFKKKHDNDVREIYHETLDDLYDEYYYIRRPLKGRNRVIELIRSGTLVKELKEPWDALVVAFWIYTNHKILYGPYKEYDDLLDQVKKLHDSTYRVMIMRDQAIAGRIFAELEVRNQNAAPQ